MCGIIGAVCRASQSGSAKAVIDGLKRLEYRGYDSFGFCFPKGGRLIAVKRVGRIGGFSENVDSDAGICIGHTRWATHGRVSEENAHPHLSNNGRIAVVHNGIIENYQELRESLEYAGFSFASETDSEVIPNMIEFYMEHERKDLISALTETLSRIEGSYAVVVMHLDFDGLLSARNGSPLVAGVGKNANYIASDITAFLPYTRNVIYLEEDEMAVIGKELVKIFDLKKNREVKRESCEVNWSMEQAERGEYADFMIKEINEQPMAVKRAVGQQPALVERAASMIKEARGVFFLGCGTSYHACISSAYIFAHVAGMHVNAVLASEFRNYTEFVTPQTLVVAVSQSGETADLLDAVREARKKGAKVISIVNVMGSTLMRLSDETMLMNAGPEICVLSTKSYTAQLAILLLLAYAVAGRAAEGKQLVEKTAGLIGKTIKDSEPTAAELAKRFRDAKSLFLIGRDLAYPTALEGALKVKEVSYIHAEGFAGAELKHGTIALIEENTPVVAFSTDATRELTLSNAAEVKSRGAFVIGIDSKPNRVFDSCFIMEEAGFANPILMIVPMQLLAYHLAKERGCDVEKPRSLAKSVTVK